MKFSDLWIGTGMYLGFSGIVLLLVALVAVAYVNLARLGDANDISIHTYRVLARVNGSMEALINIETGQRGFALTGNEAALAPYNDGKEAFRASLAEATEFTADNPQQQERLKRLSQIEQEWMATAVDPVIGGGGGRA